MKRLLTLLIMLFVVTVMLIGCSSGSTTAEERSAAEIGELIKQEVSLAEMKQGDVEKLNKLYSIQTESVEDFVLYTSSSNVKADELAIIKVKEVGDVDHLIENIQKRLEAQKDKFQDYRPQEFYLIEKHVLKTKGRFLLFAVSEEAERMAEVFDDHH